VGKISIRLLGLGRLGIALEHRLSEAGYKVLKTNPRHMPRGKLPADAVWFCVPDREIAAVARKFSGALSGGRYAFHSSGALTSDVLGLLRRSGTEVASVHPLMTFVTGSVPELRGVPFAIEGDQSAVRMGRRIVRHLGGDPVDIRKRDKAGYHAFATMICPMLVSLLASAEKAASVAGMSGRKARRLMMPIVRQTLANYQRLGPGGAFSGPIVRGDVDTVRAHLQAFRSRPASRAVYTALARAALEYLPSANRRGLTQLLET